MTLELERGTYKDLNIRVHLLRLRQVNLDLKGLQCVGCDNIGVVVVEECGERDALVPARALDLDGALRSAMCELGLGFLG